MKKTGDKWYTEKCGSCGDQHKWYSGKLDADGVEYVVCGNTNKRVNINASWNLHSGRDEIAVSTHYGNRLIRMSHKWTMVMTVDETNRLIDALRMAIDSLPAEY